MLDRDGHAEMSCIAGVGGNVPSLVRKAVNAAQTGRPIIGIDGCALACVRGSLAQRGIEPTMHLQLGEHGVPKEYHADFSEAQADSLYEQLRRRIEVMTVWMR